MKRLKNKIIEKFYILMIRINRIEYLFQIPKKFISNKLCLTAFKKNPENVKYFPKDKTDLFKEDIIIKAIKYEPFLIADIPKEYITTKIVLAAFRLNPTTIVYFPEDNPDLFTESLIINAIHHDPSVIENIPEKYITNTAYLTAFNYDYDLIMKFPKDRLELFKEDICLKAIEYDGRLFKFIPEECRTTKVSLLAFDKYPYSIAFFPKDNTELFKEEILLKAIDHDDSIIRSIPKKYITNKVYLAAFEKNRNNIKYFPKDRQELFKESLCTRVY